MSTNVTQWFPHCRRRDLFVGWLVCLFVCLFLDFPTVTTPCRRPRARSRCVIDVVMARCHGNRFVSHSSAVCLRKKKRVRRLFSFRNWKHGHDFVSLNSKFAWVFIGCSLVFLYFTRFYYVALGFTGFYWVLLGFHWISYGFMVFYWVLLTCTGFYWVLLGFHGV